MPNHALRLATLALAGSLVLAVSSSIVACGGGGGARVANVKPDDMPSGETWQGVYYHPVYGYLHLVEQDNNVVGKWKRTDQGAWGELSGVKVGNVLHFTWKEHKYGMVGPASESHGKGYFVYKMGPEGIAELDGQFGIGDDETGADWHNVKQQRMNPDLNSIKGADQTGVPAVHDNSWR